MLRIGDLGAATSPYRTWGGNFDDYGIGPIRIILVVLALLDDM